MDKPPNAGGSGKGAVCDIIFPKFFNISVSWKQNMNLIGRHNAGVGHL